jgi:hypothetical protein
VNAGTNSIEGMTMADVHQDVPPAAVSPNQDAFQVEFLIKDLTRQPVKDKMSATFGGPGCGCSFFGPDK